MSDRFHEIPEDVLWTLIGALRTGRLRPPFTQTAVAHIVGGPSWLADTLIDAGQPIPSLLWGLELLARERTRWRTRWEGVALTWTGPEEVATETRDTGAVARQLFSAAQRSLLISTYVLDEGAKGEHLLTILRSRMEACPALDVQIYVNLARKYEDKRPTATILAEHAKRLRDTVFTWEPRPSIFYDHRALELVQGPRACLHAKVIVCDEAQTLITSANLTEAAQERNIEAGVLIDDAAFARGVIGQFERLVEARVLVRLPGWGAA